MSPSPPDVIGYLPGLRTFRAVDDTIASTVCQYTYGPGENVAEHLGPASNPFAMPHTLGNITVSVSTANPNNAWLAMMGYTEAGPPPVHETPTSGCECGFYGWYPWAEARFNGVTPLDEDDARAHFARPHPAAKDALITWWRAAGSVSVNIPVLPRIQPYIIGVLDTYGKVVLHDHGVRASRGRLRALVDPLSVAAHTMPERLHDWGTLLSQGWISRGVNELQLVRWLPTILELVGVKTYELARIYDIPVIDFTTALTFANEWDVIRSRILANESGGHPG